MYCEYLILIHKESSCHSESDRAMVLQTRRKREGALKNRFESLDKGNFLFDGRAVLVGKD